MNVQAKNYPEVLEFLKELEGEKLKSIKGKQIVRSKRLSTPSICLNLHLILDPKGIIRVNTSISNCLNLSYDQRYPILMPASDLYTKLLIMHSHVESGHMGLHYSRSHLRAKYWIPKSTNAINDVVNKCKICSVQRGKRYHVPDSPALPEYRFNVNDPWSTTALDMTGHMFARDSSTDNTTKVYFIIFVCMSTGAGHIEMVPDASSESFANALERFAARRGIPVRLVSDQGSNFKGYNLELKKIADENIVHNYLTDKGILWKWTPIGDPHFNGYCERHLGILKCIMKKSIGNKILSHDQIHTIACYAESLFNERPLCVMDAGDPDFIPITPNMLNYGRNLRHFAHDIGSIDFNDPEFKLTNKNLNVMSRKLRSSLAQVRKIWIRDYLHLLTKRDNERQNRAPNTKSLIQPKVDDWVIIRDDSSDLRLGRITKLIPSSDNEIRSAQVKTKSGNGCYPITNLRYLEFHNEGKNEHDLAHLKTSISERASRPQRKAAIEAQSKFVMNCLFSSEAVWHNN